MDISAHLASRSSLEVPRLGLAAPPRRLGWALVLAIGLHVLTPLGLVLLVPAMITPSLPPSALAAPQTTPVKVVFYEDPPASAATPPTNTAEVSDSTRRARSEVAPTPGKERLPAAVGSSKERRAERTGAVQPPPQALAVSPPAASPAPAVTPAPPLARSTPTATLAALQVPDDAIPPSSADLARLAARARAIRAARVIDETMTTARPGFSADAIDSAVQARSSASRSGYGHAASDVSETGSLSFDAKDYEWGPYARKVFEIVDRNWKSVMPLAAQTPGVRGRVRLRFRILRSGRLEGLELIESSQQRALDQASLASIELSDPLPPLPTDFGRDEVGVTFSYFYNLDPE